jgi:hypothetical protein
MPVFHRVLILIYFVPSPPLPLRSPDPFIYTPPHRIYIRLSVFPGPVSDSPLRYGQACIQTLCMCFLLTRKRNLSIVYDSLNYCHASHVHGPAICCCCFLRFYFSFKPVCTAGGSRHGTEKSRGLLLLDLPLLLKTYYPFI